MLIFSPIARCQIARSAGALALVCLSLNSCDKAKEMLSGKAKLPTASVVPQHEPGGTVDPEMAGQVHKTDEGVSFRKDLPFPVALSVRTEERTIWSNARLISKSELGMESSAFNATYDTAITWKLAKGLATIHVEKAATDGAPQVSASMIPPPPPPPQAGKGKTPPAKAPNASIAADLTKKQASPAGSPAKPSPGAAPAGAGPAAPAGPALELDGLGPLVGKTASLQRTSNGWTRGAAADGKESEFQEVVWSRSLSPMAGGLFSEVGLTPRPRWFPADHVWKAGETMALKGESLSLLFAGKSSGSVTLTFEEMEAVEGHPAGRFAIEGTVDIAGMPAPDGEPLQAKLSIVSGKIWCSVLHPVVLREEYEAVETLARGSGDAPTVTIQGTANVLKRLEWNRDAATADEAENDRDICVPAGRR